MLAPGLDEKRQDIRTYTVETCVTLWQLRDFSGLFNGKSSRPIGSLEIFEAVDGNTRSTGCELQQSGLRYAVTVSKSKGKGRRKTYLSLGRP